MTAGPGSGAIATPLYALSVSGLSDGVHELKIQGKNAAGTGTVRDVIYITLSGDAQSSGPTANAGPDQTVLDANGNGTEAITLDGTGSSDDLGIDSYTWSIGSNQIATGATPTVSLGVGTQAITLTVTDSDGNTASDSVTITVNAPATGSGAIEVVDTGASLAGAAASSNANFTINKSNTSPANYLIISQSARAHPSRSSPTPAPMVELASTSESAARIQYFGLANPPASGQVDADYDGMIWGTQVFAHAYLRNVDTAAPVRGAASDAGYFGSNGAATQGTLALTVSAQAGDLALAAGNRDGSGASINIGPRDDSLYEGNAEASFSAGIALDAQLSTGSYSTSVTTSSSSRARALAAALVLAASGDDAGRGRATNSLYIELEDADNAAKAALLRSRSHPIA